MIEAMTYRWYDHSQDSPGSRIGRQGAATDPTAGVLNTHAGGSGGGDPVLQPQGPGHDLGPWRIYDGK